MVLGDEVIAHFFFLLFAFIFLVNFCLLLEEGVEAASSALSRASLAKPWVSTLPNQDQELPETRRET
jgi:hypothetical protein